MNITFIGSGYVGLVSGACIADFDHNVICMDIDREKIEKLKQGIIPIYEPGLSELIKKNTKLNRLKFTTNLKQAINKSDVIFLAVGTPSDDSGKVEMKYLFNAIDNILRYLNSYKVIVIKSTVPPGTACQLKDKLNEKNINKKFYDIVSNPEFLREGSAIKDFMIPDRIVIGSESKKAIKLVENIYQPLFLRDIPLVITNHETAELIKYATNAFLATKISFINEIALLCTKMNADIKTISQSLGLDGRISSKFLHPGPGFGGSCFPKDVSGLLSIINSFHLKGNVINSVLKTNNQQKQYMFDMFKHMLSNNLRGKKISVLGLAFKPNTDDIRESPSIVIIEQLIANDAIVYGYDPEACDNMKLIFPNVNFSDNLDYVLKDSEGAILLTEWNSLRSLNPNKIKKVMKSNKFMDCRNIYNPKEWIDEGFIFKNIGRI